VWLHRIVIPMQKGCMTFNCSKRVDSRFHGNDAQVLSQLLWCFLVKCRLEQLSSPCRRGSMPFNCRKRMDFELLLDMARFHGNDIQVLSQLF